MSKKTHICFLLAIAVTALLAALIYIGIPVCRFTGEVLFLIAGVLAGFYILLLLKRKKAGRILLGVYTFCICIGLTVAFVTGFCILDASRGSDAPAVDYVIVLGAGVHGDVPSLSLSNRIRGAYDYLVAHPDAVCIASGGQGEGERLSEAACIERELVRMGISPERIWLEERSTSTLENLSFSMQVLADHGVKDPGPVGILSSEYHLFRAGYFADKLGISYEGIPAHTTIFGLWVNYMLRETVAIWYHIILGGNR